jgi:multidrug efflux pump subunit AcrA (membrane-fusion protein)
MLVQYFVLEDKDHGLKPNERVRIDLELADKEGKSKIVPYSAVHYDPNGGEWVYVETKPHTYQRHPIKISRIAQGTALVSKGPAVGTKIVNVGVAMLHGIEVYGR